MLYNIALNNYTHFLLAEKKLNMLLTDLGLLLSLMGAAVTARALVKVRLTPIVELLFPESVAVPVLPLTTLRTARLLLLDGSLIDVTALTELCTSDNCFAEGRGGGGWVLG